MEKEAAKKLIQAKSVDEVIEIVKASGWIIMPDQASVLFVKV